MALNLLRSAGVRMLMRRAFSTSQAHHVAGPALTDDPNVNTDFYESMITPLPPKPRLFCLTPDLKELKKKEQGDWKKLSEDEMRQLYDAYFSMTVADMERSTDLWKHILGGSMVMLGLALLLHWFVHVYINPPYLDSVTNQEYITANIKRMLQQNQGHITGYSASWDYENNCWKK